MAGKRKAESSPEDCRRSSRLQGKARKIYDEDAEPTIVTADEQEHVASNSASHSGPPEQTQLASTETVPDKPKRFRRPRQRKRCAFINKLPGEIRNRIYRYALVEIDDIEITTTGPGEPSLLRVCKRIRTEARSIYYAENDFELQIEDYNGAEFKPFIRQWKDHEYLMQIDRPGHNNISMSFDGGPDWDNLVEWIAFNHNTWYKLLPNKIRAGCQCFRFFLSAFKIAKNMQGLPWSKVADSLEALRDAILGMPSRWSESWDDDDW